VPALEVCLAGLLAAHDTEVARRVHDHAFLPSFGGHRYKFGWLCLSISMSRKADRREFTTILAITVVRRVMAPCKVRTTTCESLVS